MDKIKFLTNVFKLVKHKNIQPNTKLLVDRDWENGKNNLEKYIYIRNKLELLENKTVDITKKKENYYIYMNVKAEDYSYYIGKGTGGRAYEHKKGSRSKYWDQTFKGSDYVTIIIIEKITEERSFIIEKFLIKLMKEVWADASCINDSDGGEGNTNTKQKLNTIRNMLKYLVETGQDKFIRSNPYYDTIGMYIKPTGCFHDPKYVGKSHKQVLEMVEKNILKDLDDTILIYEL